MTRGEPSVVVEMDRVSYRYPRAEHYALRDISLTLHRGQLVGLIGPTGAGKSTLCQALNGIVPQFHRGRFFGRVRVAGLDTVETPVSTLARHVGMVLQDPEAQLVATSVESEIAFALENVGVPREEIRARIPRALEAVRLEGTERKNPRELSGGQKQRLAIAAGLAMQPDLLVLDEPISQLDPVGGQEVFATVRELNRELGITVLLASHAAEELAEHADRIVLLGHGQVQAEGTPETIYADVARLKAHHVRPPQVAATFDLLAAHPEARGIGVPVRLSDGVARLDRVQEVMEVRERSLASPPVAPAGPENPALATRGLGHTYPDGTKALEAVDLEVRRGEFVLIVGQNGAGKSTLVKHFLNLLRPTEGAVLVDGADTRTLHMSDLARRIGYVAQNPDNQIFSTTVADEVAFAPRNLGFPADEVEQRTARSLEAMGLLAQRDAHPLSLPKGDRSRIVIAAVLALEPETIILDEPTVGQDHRGARCILELSRQLHRMGKTVIVITHHLYLMPGFAERVLVMRRGRLIFDGPLRDAFHELDILRSSYVSPPQAVLLARELARRSGARLPLLTPEELAGCLTPRAREAVHG